jgi:hypothetical protein
MFPGSEGKGDTALSYLSHQDCGLDVTSDLAPFAFTVRALRAAKTSLLRMVQDLRLPKTV